MCYISRCYLLDSRHENLCSTLSGYHQITNQLLTIPERRDAKSAEGLPFPVRPERGLRRSAGLANRLHSWLMKLRVLFVLAGLAAVLVLVARRSPAVVQPPADRGIWVPVPTDP